MGNLGFSLLMRTNFNLTLFDLCKPRVFTSLVSLHLDFLPILSVPKPYQVHTKSITYWTSYGLGTTQVIVRYGSSISMTSKNIQFCRGIFLCLIP
jgi:hypothetical protein